MKQITTLEKINNNKEIIDSSTKIKIRNILNPALLLASKTNIKYKIKKEGPCNIEPGRPIIYAVNHYSAQDTPIICNSIENRGYILAGKQPLRFIDDIFFKIYGTVFVDRKNKDDMLQSKNAMEAYLNKNENIIMFPEGTWNLTDELLMLPMKWGIIEVAQNTNAQIIPVNLDYDRDNKLCRVSFGTAIIPDKEKTKKEQIDNLRDTMATISWYNIEKKEQLVRAKVDVEELRKEFMKTVEEYPKLDLGYEQSVVFKPYPSPEEVFEPIKKLSLKKENAFMFYKNNIGMR